MADPADYNEFYADRRAELLSQLQARARSYDVLENPPNTPNYMPPFSAAPLLLVALAASVYYFVKQTGLI
jgi:hypothetical protein